MRDSHCALVDFSIHYAIKFNEQGVINGGFGLEVHDRFQIEINLISRQFVLEGTSGVF